MAIPICAQFMLILFVVNLLNPPEILALYEKNLEELIDLSNFCVTHMLGLEVHVE